jgi:pyruvate/2-oxoglutarate dehydrogenase complex dihydrolipoamide acyltransferase (E2) component
VIYNLAVPGPIEDVEEVRVLEWHGSVGSPIEPGQLIVELETHKAVVEVRAGQKGILRRIESAAGDWQAIGKPIAMLSDTADETLPDTADGSTPLNVEFEIT